MQITAVICWRTYSKGWLPPLSIKKSDLCLCLLVRKVWNVSSSPSQILAIFRRFSSYPCLLPLSPVAQGKWSRVLWEWKTQPHGSSRAGAWSLHLLHRSPLLKIKTDHGYSIHLDTSSCHLRVERWRRPWIFANCLCNRDLTIPSGANYLMCHKYLVLDLRAWPLPEKNPKIPPNCSKCFLLSLKKTLI